MATSLMLLELHTAIHLVMNLSVSVAGTIQFVIPVSISVAAAE